MTQQERYVVQKVFDDPSENSVVNQRFIQGILQVASSTDLSKDEQHDLLDLSILTARKLVAVWQHNKDFSQHQENLVKQAEAKPLLHTDKILQIETSLDLFIEFDEFLVQVKSCLDYLVKIPTVAFGKSVWTHRTFGDKGESVLSSIERNLPARFSENSKGMVHTIKKHQAWLIDVIDARDKINHFIDGGVDFNGFTVFCAIEKSGEKKTHVPMWSSNQTVLAFMDVVWDNLFRMCEDFVVSTLYCRFKPGLALIHDKIELPDPTSPWSIVSQNELDEIVKRTGAQKIDLS
jgi:hypothetical protein